MRRAARPVLLALLAALLASARAPGAERWFRSDEMGMAIEPIPAFRADEFPWVLGVERREAAGGGWVETRRLLGGGVEQRRWTLARAADGRTEEREERRGLLVARRVTGAAGELLQEELFAGGEPAGRSLYEYASGRLARVRVFAADGTLVSTVEYATSPSGRLREVRWWTAADGSRRTESQAAGGTGYAAGGAAIAEERTRDGDRWRTTRYDEAGRVAERLQGGPTGVESRERLAYAGAARTPASSWTEWPAERKVVEVSYDASGAEVARVTSVDGTVTERIAWTRDGSGRALVMRRTGTGGSVEVRFTWAADGTLEREEHFARGVRVKNVLYPAAGEEPRRIEELFDEGVLFLRVHYRGEDRVREEVIVDGRTVRERTFAP